MLFSAVFSLCLAAMVIYSDAGTVGILKTDEPVENPKPYGFQYKMDDGKGTLQHRQEVSNEYGEVKGSYGYRDANGTFRQVSYIADNNGFQVKIDSNEPGIMKKNSANVIYNNDQESTV